jgi:hypothetical protein
MNEDFLRAANHAAMPEARGYGTGSSLNAFSKV